MEDSAFEQQMKEHPHGGKRKPRKVKGLQLMTLHAHVAPEAYEWVAEVAEAMGLGKGEVLEHMLLRDKRRAQRRTERASIKLEMATEAHQ